jgi:Helicase HerA, central domain
MPEPRLTWAEPKVLRRLRGQFLLRHGPHSHEFLLPEREQAEQKTGYVPELEGTALARAMAFGAPATWKQDVQIARIDDTVRLRGGGHRRVFEVQGVPYELYSAEEAESFLRRWASLLNAAPADGMQLVVRTLEGGIQKYVEERRTAAKRYEQPTYRRLALASASHIERLACSGDARSLQFYLCVPGKTAKQAAEAGGQLERVAGRLGLMLRPIVGEELIGTLARLWRGDVPSHWWYGAAGVHEAPAFHHRTPHAQDRIAPLWTTKSKDVYVVEGVYTRTIMVSQLPPVVHSGWLLPFLRLGGDVTISQQITPLTAQETTRLLKMRRIQHLSAELSRASGGRLSDPLEALALESATAVEAQVVAGQAKLFRLALTITIRATSKDELKDVENLVMDRLQTLQATAWPATLEHPEGFHDSLPLMRRKLRREQTVDTTTLAYCFPYSASVVSMGAGALWGLATRDRRLVLYDVWAPEGGGPAAPHFCIIAPTGAGKSFAFFAVLCEMLFGGGPYTPDQVMLVDPKGDYEKACKLLAGTHLVWGTQPQQTVNVMDIDPAVGFDQTILDVLGFLSLAVSTPQYPLSPEEYGALAAAVKATYQKAGIDRGRAATWRPERMPTLADLYQVLKDEREWGNRSLANRLQPFAEPPWGALFAQKTTADLDSPLIVFDLKAITQRQDDRLRGLATYLVALLVWRATNRSHQEGRLIRRLVGLDEVETLLANPETALLVGNLLSLGRSFGLCIGHMSQQWVGYTQTQQGQRALTNTPTKLLLRQEGGVNLDQVTRDLKLFPEQRDFLLNAAIGFPGKHGSQGLLVTNRGREHIEILPPPEVMALMIRSRAQLEALFGPQVPAEVVG